MTFFMSFWASIKNYVGDGPEFLVVKLKEETPDGLRKHFTDFSFHLLLRVLPWLKCEHLLVSCRLMYVW
jgi:hypothetical protein